ncbi:Ribonuclease D [Labrenzia sp. THAF191b]|jgi:ribonuclease D|uniref:ribonuclease D n=1 Tax=unclassified Labrenzia TaxID=2648686 RepID=UPI0012696D0D|nr:MULTISPECIES: ribonuclease D [unclassified Labrenzia]QFT00338.1 Ribonuclease D [Labrenzia sp. THAF191b]QFT06651.1 Ribonuclease D [Labrenzia sp. THAF191a]QFT18195.1 Ribonuclease D [Labrenzia sp. THAF187b]
MHVITKTKDLAAACQRLAAHDYVTVDTEFLRETTFWPKLCVIQMAGPDMAFIVDALSEGLDLEPFFELMRDGNVTKVFHAARQDIEIIYHLGELIPAPLFDTQVAAMVCGFGDSISYDQLVYKVTGARIDKSSRFTDWARRPLTAKQLDYALADVTHLRDAYQFLKANLAEQDRSHWVQDEMQVLTSINTYRTDPEQAWKRLKLRVRKPVELAVMMEVAAWREREAQSRDVPRSRVIKDDAIYELAAQQPQDAESLARLRTIPRGFERSKSADEILKAVRRAVSLPKNEMPKLPKGRQAPDGSAAAVDLLKVLLKLVSEAHGVAAKVIATVDDLEKIAADDAADVAAMKGWRRELFGETALKLKRGEVALAFQERQIVAIDQPRQANVESEAAE